METVGGSRIDYLEVRSMVREYLEGFEDPYKEGVSLLAMLYTIIEGINKEREERRKEESEKDRKDINSRL